MYTILSQGVKKFWTVASHVDWPEKFYFGCVSPLIGQNETKYMYWKVTVTKKAVSSNKFCCFQLNRVKAVEKEKDELEGSKNEAVEYLKMENSITKQRNVLFQRYM